MGLFGINYELEKGTSFGFGNVCGSSGSGGFPPAHCCLVYVFIQLSPHSPPHPCRLSLLVACAGNPNGMPTALEEEGGSKCKGRWPVGDGWGIVSMAMEPGQWSAFEMKLLPRSNQNCFYLHGKLFPTWLLLFAHSFSRFSPFSGRNKNRNQKSLLPSIFDFFLLP